MKKLALFATAFVFLFLLSMNGCLGPKEANTTISNLSFKIGAGSNQMLGNADAPITIVEFTDYQCPFCKKHAVETVPKIEEDYVKTGKVKYYLRDFPLVQIHKTATSAAIAARCAGEQGKYWEMHSLLFEKQADWAGLLGIQLSSKFAEYAAMSGVNDELFSVCYSSGKYDSEVSDDTSAGKLYGIVGTPTSLIILPKSTDEAKLVSILSAYPDYSGRGLISLSRDPEGNYVFFIKGAFPYTIFQQVLDSAAK